jgi:hypothetical protein
MVEYRDDELAGFLRRTVEKELPELRSLTPEQASTPRGGEVSWSPKQELGHLIDSASNNHMRFVRAALDGVYEGPGYEQNGWVNLHGYQGMPWETPIEFWRRYNELLAELIERIPASAFDAECRIGPGIPAALRVVVTSYVLHIQHHVDQILKRPEITKY